MTGRLLALVLAVVMLAGGGFLALAGMGYLGSDTSTPWTILGSLLAGLGVALVITIVQRRH